MTTTPKPKPHYQTTIIGHLYRQGLSPFMKPRKKGGDTRPKQQPLLLTQPTKPTRHEEEAPLLLLERSSR